VHGEHAHGHGLNLGGVRPVARHQQRSNGDGDSKRNGDAF
jgi:hypothetical protein